MEIKAFFPSMLQNSMQFVRSNTPAFIHGFNFLALFVLLYFIIRGVSPYPYSDDWMLTPYVTGESPVTAEWLWEQHVDHRLPLPKAVWIISLKASGMDFRAVVVLIAALAFVASFTLLKAIAAHRGHLVFGDIVLPLLLLNPSFNIFTWGFYLQFMLSISLLLISVALGILHFKNPKGWSASLAAIAIACLAGTGMNGTVIAAIMAPSLMLAIFLDRANMQPAKLTITLSLLTGALFTAIFMIASWKPSDAAPLSTSDLVNLDGLYKVMTAFSALLMPRAWANGLLPINVYLFAGFLLSAIAVVVVSRHLIHRQTPVLVFLAGAFLASWAVIGAIAVGRALFWSPGIEFHYGFFPVLPTIVAWAMLSVCLQSKSSRFILHTALLIVFMPLYVKGVEWGAANAEARHEQLLDIHTDLSNGRPIDLIVAENISVLWWKSDPEGIALVSKNLSYVYQLGYYR